MANKLIHVGRTIDYMLSLRDIFAFRQEEEQVKGKHRKKPLPGQCDFIEVSLVVKSSLFIPSLLLRTMWVCLFELLSLSVFTNKSEKLCRICGLARDIDHRHHDHLQSSSFRQKIFEYKSGSGRERDLIRELIVAPFPGQLI